VLAAVILVQLIMIILFFSKAVSSDECSRMFSNFVQPMISWRTEFAVLVFW